MDPAVYTIAAILVVGFAVLVFRVLVRRDYRRKGRLTLFTTSLEWTVFGLLGVFTSFDRPPEWPPATVSMPLRIVGWTLVLLGAVGLVGVMTAFGFRRANGLEVNTLKQSGPYRLTRNPQVLALGVALLGYALLSYSWHALGWIVLYGVIVHMMLLTEEEHLRAAHGEEYVDYCRRVPRYFGVHREFRNDAA